MTDRGGAFLTTGSSEFSKKFSCSDFTVDFVAGCNRRRGIGVPSGSCRRLLLLMYLGSAWRPQVRVGSRRRVTQGEFFTQLFVFSSVVGNYIFAPIRGSEVFPETSLRTDCKNYCRDWRYPILKYIYIYMYFVHINGVISIYQVYLYGSAQREG